jgi:hypothetical protein
MPHSPSPHIRNGKHHTAVHSYTMSASLQISCRLPGIDRASDPGGNPVEVRTIASKIQQSTDEDESAATSGAQRMCHPPTHARTLSQATHRRKSLTRL